MSILSRRLSEARDARTVIDALLRERPLQRGIFHHDFHLYFLERELIVNVAE
jgi:hypothetical protein